MLANLLKEGKVRIAYARHEEMTEIDSVHDSADPILFKRLFEKEGFQTPWRLIHAAIYSA